MQLANHILRIESLLYGLTPIAVRKLAYEVAALNDISSRFDSDKGMAWANICDHFSNDIVIFLYIPHRLFPLQELLASINHKSTIF